MILLFYAQSYENDSRKTMVGKLFMTITKEKKTMIAKLLMNVSYC